MSSRKPLINTIIYTFSSFLRKSISFLLIPVYTRVLTTQDYGVVGIITGVYTVLNVFFNLSLDSAIVRFYFNKNSVSDYHKKLYGSIITVIIALGIIFSMFFVSTAKWIISPFLKGIEIYPYFYLGIIIVATTPMFTIHQNILKAQQNGLRFATQNLSRYTMQLLLILLFVVVYKTGALGVLGARAITGMVFYVFSLVILTKNYGLHFNKPILKETMSYSIPLIPNKIALFVSLAINTVVINSYKSTSDVGIFHVGSQFAMIILVFIQSIATACLPWCFDQLENHGMDGKKKIIRIFNMLLIMFSTFALITSLFMEEIIKFVVSESFGTAWIVYSFLTFTYVFHIIKNVWLVPLLYNKKGTKFIPISTYVNVILILIFSLLLIPRYGIIGAGISTLLARFISSFVMMYFSRKVEDIGYIPIKVYTYPLIMFVLSNIIFIPIPYLFIVKLLLSISAALIAYKIIGSDLALIYNILFNKNRKTV
ncbi:MAG: oligosaccharide flippase family protein [Candidatus Aureabacteria bacterium]|nr:oligosaccharide flippase family protein [Candidatus Auribacterota bacterium]